MVPTTSLVLLLLSVAFISLSGVMMPGPLTAVVVAKSHRDGSAGFRTALGHGVIEFPLMSLIYFGLGSLFALPFFKVAIGLLGGLMLLYMAVGMFQQMRRAAEVDRDLPYGSFVGGIVTTAANPYFFLWWATIGAALVASATLFGLWGFVLFAFTHWFLDLAWLLILSFSIFKSRRWWTPRVKSVVFGVCGALLVGYGLWFLYSVPQFLA